MKSNAQDEGVPRTNFSNFTIIVNWKEKGFGCSRKCSYYNWRASPLLPHGPHTVAQVKKFVLHCNKSFITISGGGDPLYGFADHPQDLTNLARTVRDQWYREVQYLSRLDCLAEYISISLDMDVLALLDRDFPALSHTKFKFDLEFSLVLPPWPEDELVKLMPQYIALYRKLGHRLVLRENLNSIYSISASALAVGRRGIVFVPKTLCLSGRYLSTIDSTGESPRVC